MLSIYKSIDRDKYFRIFSLYSFNIIVEINFVTTFVIPISYITFAFVILRAFCLILHHMCAVMQTVAALNRSISHFVRHSNELSRVLKVIFYLCKTILSYFQAILADFWVSHICIERYRKYTQRFLEFH